MIERINKIVYDYNVEQVDLGEFYISEVSLKIFPVDNEKEVANIVLHYFSKKDKYYVSEIKLPTTTVQLRKYELAYRLIYYVITKAGIEYTDLNWSSQSFFGADFKKVIEEMFV